MIIVNIKKKDKEVKEIIIKGHADYDNLGKDIVCAAVSTMAITSINNIIALEETIDYEEKAGLLKIRVLNDTEINQKILDNLIRMLKELSCQYPKNIEIRNEV